MEELEPAIAWARAAGGRKAPARGAGRGRGARGPGAAHGAARRSQRRVHPLPRPETRGLEPWKTTAPYRFWSATKPASWPGSPGFSPGAGFNIYSLAVGETDDPKVSRISVVVAGDPPVIDQVVKQLRRLVSVIKVSDLTGRPRVERGLLLIKVNAPHDKRSELLQLVQIFRARVDHVDNQMPDPGGHRQPREAGGLHRPAQAPRHPGDGPHRSDRHGPHPGAHGRLLEPSGRRLRTGRGRHLQYQPGGRAPGPRDRYTRLRRFAAL